MLCENSVMLVDQDLCGTATANSFAPSSKNTQGVGVGMTHLSSALLPSTRPPAGSAAAIFEAKLTELVYGQGNETSEDRPESFVVDESVCEVLSSAACNFISPNVALLSTNR